MKKLFAFLIMALVGCCFFALGVSAQATDEFGVPQTIENIDLTGMSSDTSKRVVIKDGDEYLTFPSCYIVSEKEKFYYDFNPINNALGKKFNKNSVVRIEVPDTVKIATDCGDLCSATELKEIKFFPTSQCHTLEYGCFYNNKKLEKLNIPKSVTTMETLIINNSTLKELVFDDGFCAIPPKDSFRGAEGVEKVVFSNQMTSVGDRAFDSTLGTSLKEFYFGANLKDLGTNNMAWVKQSVKFYISDAFLTEVDVITMETYSWWSSTACLPTGVIFYTGTKEEANALISKSTYDRVFCTGAELVEWDSSIDDDSYLPTSGWRIVYNYGVCNAFYGGEHNMPENESLCVESFFKPITVGNVCTREGCGLGTVIKTIAPVFEFLGYSHNNYGIYSVVAGYKIDHNAYFEYLDYGYLEYGFVLSYVGVTGNEPLCVQDGKVMAKNEDKTFHLKQKYMVHEYIDVKLTGLNDDDNGKEFVMTMYVFDGESIIYLNDTKVIEMSK